jgi:hypothetical protein
MTSGARPTRIAAPVRALLALAMAIACAGCASQEDIRDAINAINREFQNEYEKILDEKGTRLFSANPSETFDATNAALVSLGMVVRQQSRGIGYLNAAAPAPAPLSRSEWDRAAAADLPRAREILSKHVGLLAEFFHFEPEGLDVVINATVIPEGTGSAVSLTMRMREVAPPKSGLPRREYPPPTGVRIGLDKIFETVQRELDARRRVKP